MYPHHTHSSIDECNQVEKWEPKILKDQRIRDGWPPLPPPPTPSLWGLKWENIFPYWPKLFLKHDLRQEPALKDCAKMQWLLQFAKYSKGRIVQFSWDQSIMNKRSHSSTFPNHQPFKQLKSVVVSSTSNFLLTLYFSW